MRMIAAVWLIFIGCLLQPPPAGAETMSPLPKSTAAEQWQQIERGLDLGEFVSPQRSETGDSVIRILRIDPQLFELKLMNASAAGNGRALTARQWCRHYGLVAAVNASMYQQDYKTSVSLMRSRGHVNNARLSKDMAILAFDRLTPDVPPVKIIDRECDDFSDWKDRYGTLVQSIRMLSCTGRNVWSPQPQKWSTAAIAIDRQGRVMFIHARSPFRTHDLINNLRRLPLDIDRALYTEGGPQAQLFVNGGDQQWEFVGRVESNLGDASAVSIAMPIPNAVGVVRKAGRKK
jgi:uncharacterized protein YigE (DUF2233 family)